MKSAVFVVLFSTLVILEVSCQERCGILRPPCGDNQCCALLPILGRRCRDLGQAGESCLISGFNRCPCAEGLTCAFPSFRCEDRRPTTTEEPDTTTTEGSTTTTEGSTTTTEGTTTTTEGSTTTTEETTTT